MRIPSASVVLPSTYHKISVDSGLDITELWKGWIEALGPRLVLARESPPDMFKLPRRIMLESGNTVK